MQVNILENSNLLTIKEVAEIFKIAESTVRSWIRRTHLPNNMIFRVGKFVRIRKNQLEQFINCGEL